MMSGYVECLPGQERVNVQGRKKKKSREKVGEK